MVCCNRTALNWSKTPVAPGPAHHANRPDYPFVSVKDFTLANFDVTTTNATVYERCKPSDLRLNARATLVGHLQDGKLVADKISLLADVEWKIQGPISEIRNMSLEGGEILVQGSWLRLTAATRVDSELSMAGDRMKFANLRVNDYVVLTGRQEGTQPSGDQH